MSAIQTSRHFVVAPAHSDKTAGQRLNVTRVFVAPCWWNCDDPWIMGHDMALLQLDEPAPKATTRPLCLPDVTDTDQAERALVGKQAVFVGWGKTEYSNQRPDLFAEDENLDKALY